MENLVNLFGRFHPLVVHFPIGILILAFLFEGLSLFRPYKKLATAIQPTLLIGAIAAIGSVATGLTLSLEGGYETKILTWHQYAGITTAALAVALYFLRKNKKIIRVEKNTRRPLRLFIFIPLMATLTITGHLGGSLTHGEEYLTSVATFSQPTVVDPSEKIRAVVDLQEAVLYDDVIQPILEARCYACHSSKKQKGELRLDAFDLIMKGGKHGSVIRNGLADSSALFMRLLLPYEDEHHMPPNEKPQLTSAQIDLIRLWINDGASSDERIKNLQEQDKAKEYITLLVEASEVNTWLPQEEISSVDEGILNQIRSSGALVIPVAVNSNYLTVSFVNSRSTENLLEQLLPIKDHVVSIQLSHKAISDQDTRTLKQFTNLTWLYLDHTSFSDADVEELTPLPNLKYLNLVDTNVTDQSVRHISKISSLEEIYLYQSGVTADGIRSLVEQIPNLKVDSGGYEIPKLSTDTIVYTKRL